MYSNFLLKILEKYYSVPLIDDKNIGIPKSILIIRQHNQLGDLLACVPLFRAIKEKFPGCKLTVVLSPQNYQGLLKNKYIDTLFVFDKKKLINPDYYFRVKKLLKKEYDLVIVPVTVSISFTSCLLSRFANAKKRIGPLILNGKENKASFFFNYRIEIDWRKHPDSNVSERCLDIVRPFGIDTTNFKSEISTDKSDIKEAENFLSKINKENNPIVIGLHVGAGKEQNRWSLIKYCDLIKQLKDKYNPVFFLTSTNSDLESVRYVQKNCKGITLPEFLNKPISEVAALISKSSLFITNDTGVMHVAGATETSQISIFGPTNPFNWAPVGSNKHFVRKSELIDDITVEDIYKLSQKILDEKFF
ncbi:MAG: glycosyltransferase family 9 protein [Bacteroidota bacterium]|nr:glycosyltransferase family 9 protein [Bacteroidota bacterium]